MTPVWYLWYAMACGLSREEAYNTPFGQVQDLTAIYQIKEEGAEYRPVLSRDEEIIPDVD